MQAQQPRYPRSPTLKHTPPRVFLPHVPPCARSPPHRPGVLQADGAQRAGGPARPRHRRGGHRAGAGRGAGRGDGAHTAAAAGATARRGGAARAGRRRGCRRSRWCRGRRRRGSRRRRRWRCWEGPGGGGAQSESARRAERVVRGCGREHERVRRCGFGGWGWRRRRRCGGRCGGAAGGDAAGCGGGADGAGCADAAGAERLDQGAWLGP